MEVQKVILCHHHTPLPPLLHPFSPSLTLICSVLLPHRWHSLSYILSRAPHFPVTLQVACCGKCPSCLLICFNWKWRMSVITILQSELHLSNSSIQMYVWKEDILAGYSTVYKQYSYAFWFLSPFCLQNPYFSLSFHGSLELQGKGEVRMMIILW